MFGVLGFALPDEDGRAEEENGLIVFVESEASEIAGSFVIFSGRVDAAARSVEFMALLMGIFGG